ncbi:MAG: single-stranded DNA-binding protein [Bifidobacteriaceae bacterium]|nr:single-stranded DNA-binding protein [Bifidobacteriaceae bacterium]
MQQLSVTMNGFVGNEPETFGKNDVGITFRLANTRRYFSNEDKQWCNGTTTWLTVKAYRSLANNIKQSVRKGDPLIVNGVLHTEEWEHEGSKRSRVILEAQNVGHDLAFGTTQFERIGKESVM